MRCLLVARFQALRPLPLTSLQSRAACLEGSIPAHGALRSIYGGIAEVSKAALFVPPQQKEGVYSMLMFGAARYFDTTAVTPLVLVGMTHIPSKYCDMQLSTQQNCRLALLLAILGPLPNTWGDIHESTRLHTIQSTRCNATEHYTLSAQIALQVDCLVAMNYLPQMSGKCCNGLAHFFARLDAVPVANSFQHFELLLLASKVIVNILNPFQWRRLVLVSCAHNQ